MASTLFFWFVFAIFTSHATASHFRGGIITWKPDENFANKVIFNFRLGFRRSFSYSYFCNSAMVANQSIVGSGDTWSASHDRGYYSGRTVADTGYHCTDFSVNEDWTQGENTFNYTFPDEGPWLVSYLSCCWISLTNGGNGDWFLSTTVNLTKRQDNGKINSSPISALSPIVRLQQGCSKTISIPAEDSDGDKVRCRWSTGYRRECGGVCQRFINSGTLDKEKCTLRLHSNVALGWHAVAITLEDFSASTTNFQMATPFSHVSLQFLVHVASSSGPCNRAPILIGQTPNDGSCEEVPDGDTFYSVIEAKHIDSSRRIAEIITVTPLYMHLTSLLNYTDHVGDIVYYKNVSWSPKLSQKGRHIFCFKAIDEYGMESDERCITILVGSNNTPRPILSSRTPITPTLSRPWKFGFVDFNITFDQKIKKPRHSKFARIVLEGHVIYKLDTRSSGDVTIGQDGFTLHFRLPQVVLSMRGNYSVTMDRGAVVGLGCTSDGPPTPGISSTSSWTFDVGVCSKGTYIDGSYYCNDVDECCNPLSVLKKRNLWWYYGYSSSPQASSAAVRPSVSASCSYYFNQRYGRFTSPNYPWNYPNNQHCTWLIEAPPGQYIYLYFGSFGLESDYNCGYDVVEVFDGNSRWSPMIKRACGQQPPCDMYSSGRFLFVKFLTDGSATYRGFSATYYAVSYNYGYSVRQRLNSYSTLWCSMTSAALNITSTSSPCSYYLNKGYGQFTSPNYPLQYPNNQLCTWLIEAPPGRYIYLHFGSFDLEYCGSCGCDVVEIFDGNSGASSMIKRACGQQPPCEMYSSGRFLFVKFSTDGSATYRGFSATYYAVSYNYVYSSRQSLADAYSTLWCSMSSAALKIPYTSSISLTKSSGYIPSTASINAPCSYYLNQRSGRFTSPNYPSHYPNYQHCTWLIEAPYGQYIYLHFGSFALERARNCVYDVVEIFDGNSRWSPMIKRACGRQSPCGMYSSGRFLFVQFSTDDSQTDRGFSATYYAVSYSIGYGVHQGLSSGATLWCNLSSTASSNPSTHSISPTKSLGYIPWTAAATAGSVNIQASVTTVTPTASRVPFVLHLPAQCQHNCVNTWGSYYCTCQPGYKLQADGKTCLDINECETQNGGCTHECINTPGSHYCKCREGTTMGFDNKTCHEPGINVKCTDEAMFISLERRSFQGFDPSKLTLLYPSCRASYNDTHITLRTNLNDCGTTHNESEDAITFYNKVRSVAFSSGNVITRDQNVSIPFYCSYGRKAIVRNPSFKTWKNYVTSSEGGYGNFTFTMDLFKSSNYYTPYNFHDYPITVNLQDRLFVQIAVEAPQSNLVVFADTCKATPSTDPYSVPQYIFLQRGCGLDSTLNYSYSISSKQRFSIQAFRFIEDHPVVHLHCEVLACHRNTARSRCLQGCSRNRGRRDEEPGSESTQVYEMSSGPLTFKKKSIGKVDKKAEAQTNMAPITAVAAAGGVFLLLAIALAVAVIHVKKHFKGALADRNKVYAMEQFNKYVKEENPYDNDGFAQDDDVNELGEQNIDMKASA
ncbi:hypothetical protein ACROYT_G002476 [Oculina patagonica]